jgi:hypothetical protein
MTNGTAPKPVISEREFLRRILGRLRSNDAKQIHDARKQVEARLQQVK